VDFAGSAWKKDLLRSKPPMNHPWPDGHP
jgi:hypothetical protein